MRPTRSSRPANARHDRLAAPKDPVAGGQALLTRLEELLSTATIVADDRPSDIITIGSTVEVEQRGTGRRATYRLTGAASGSDGRAVSARSPVGRALLGRRAGDGVSVELPDGRVEQLYVVAVAAALAEAS